MSQKVFTRKKFSEHTCCSVISIACPPRHVGRNRPHGIKVVHQKKEASNGQEIENRALKVDKIISNSLFVE